MAFPRWTEASCLQAGGSRLPGIEILFQEALPSVKLRFGRASLAGKGGAPEFSVAVGLAKYALESGEDNLSPAGDGNWKDRIRTFWSLFSHK